MSGDRVLIGAVRDDDNGIDSGSAYIFNQNESGVNLIFCHGFDVVPTDLIFRDGFEDRNC
ncbi:FG-GAP repeat protein [Marinicella pacifica]|uniref:FG-GAP repeat protein n=1 Tax=Marinicella pacifica TaxID=1171543 RepID=UPI00227AF0B4|nr:FG-GAP repeat protein [Marinicella pacifica]